MTASPTIRHDLPPADAELRIDRASLGYDGVTVCSDLDLTIAPQQLTAIIGPNGCGKSTVLRSLARLLKPTAGQVLLDGTDIHAVPSREVALRVGLLPQSAIAPDGITVYDLVARGRYPHQSLLRQWSATDAEAVQAAMAATGVEDFSTRLVDELSGGQRQRVWVAMVLAQETPTILLDEPTTFLDIAHQIDLLELFVRLRGQDRTLVAVLHDLNQAARYADRLVVMKDGTIVAQGAPHEVMSAELVEDVFGLPCRIIEDPESHTPLVVPRVRREVRELP